MPGTHSRPRFPTASTSALGLLLAAILIGRDPASAGSTPQAPAAADLRFTVESVLATDGQPAQRFFPGENVAIRLTLGNHGASDLILRRGRNYKSSKPGEWHGIVSIRAAVPGRPPVKSEIPKPLRKDRLELDFPYYDEVLPPGGEFTTTAPFGHFEIGEVGEYCFRASYYLREGALVGRPTPTLTQTTSMSFCFRVVPFEELGIRVTPEQALEIAGGAFAEAGYGDASLIQRVRRRSDGNWYTGYEFAPTGGGWHVSIVIDGQTGEVLKIAKGWHPR